MCHSWDWSVISNNALGKSFWDVPYPQPGLA